MTSVPLKSMINDMCDAQVALAREILEFAGSDTTPMAECVSRLACMVIEYADLANRDGNQAALNMVMSYGTDAFLASAALRTIRSLEARLRVVESQLKTRTDLDDRLRTVEAELTRRLPDADLH